MNFLKLLNRNKEAEPKTYEVVYGMLVERELKQAGYSPSKIQAIVNNYLAEPENQKYIDEFIELQRHRKEIKNKIKQQ
jgi:hypothetical protein